MRTGKAKTKAAPKKDRAWFGRKVAELKNDVEKSPAGRQEQLDRTEGSALGMPFGPIDYSAPAYNMALALDGMFYHAARKCYESAVESEPEVQDRLRDFERLEARVERIQAAHEGEPLKALDKLEPLYIRMSGASDGIGLAYAPLLEGVACTHILSACALESYINARATELLVGKMLDKFESADLEFKWLLLPQLMGKAGFDPGAHPFQSFSRLVKFRNALVHYKEKKEPWQDPGIPSFLEKLGLTTAEAAKSLECVSAMVSALANQLGHEPPYWLQREAGAITCFQFRCEDVEPPKGD
jgi:hypothetical protein